MAIHPRTRSRSRISPREVVILSRESRVSPYFVLREASALIHSVSFASSARLRPARLVLVRPSSIPSLFLKEL